MYDLSFEQFHRYAGRRSIEVPVLLRLGNQEIEFLAKVDTGAEYCILERVYGEQLGLSIEDGALKWMGTAVGGSFRTFGHDVTLEVLGYAFESTVYFAEDAGFRRNVLGRNGWLNKCRLAIIDHDQELYLSEYNH